MTTNERPVRPYALIGAGPMGLAMAKVLRAQGIAFQGFDLAPGVGGLWDIDAPKSTMYASAHLISSKTMTEFSDFPMRDEVAEYPSHREMKRYFDAFADHFDLKARYHFNTEVIRAEPLGGDGDGWRIVWRKADGKEEEAVFAGLLIANGTLSEPNLPEFKGQFAGEILHSSGYKHPDQVRDSGCWWWGPAIRAVILRSMRSITGSGAICRCGEDIISCRNMYSASPPTRWAGR